MKLTTLIFAVCIVLGLSASLMQAQTNHKPVIVSRFPAFADTRSLPIRFSVSAYDPDGDTLTFTWKQNASIVQVGSDSTFLLSTIPAHSPGIRITCVFSDPAGLSDSTYWTLYIPPDAVTDEHIVPSEDALAQNYPNPFNPSTTISYRLRSADHVSLKIYDVCGDLVAVLVDSRNSAGVHEIRWTPNLPSGAYYCRLATGSIVQTRKLILVK